LVKEIRAKSSVSSKNCYRSYEAVKRYFEKRLEFQKQRGSTTIVDEHSKEWDGKRRSLDAEKVRVLNRYIFPSMASIVVFLEYISKDKELQELFYKDLMALFFEVPKDKKPAEKIIVFRRFLEALRRLDFKDINLILLHQMQDTIYQNIPHIAQRQGKLDDSSIISNILDPDIGRARTWTKMLANSAKEIEFDSDKRPVNF
jgi:hypothetical protein